MCLIPMMACATSAQALWTQEIAQLRSVTNSDLAELPIANFALDGSFYDAYQFKGGPPVLSHRRTPGKGSPIIVLVRGGVAAIPSLVSHLRDPTKTHVLVQSYSSPEIDPRYDHNPWPRSPSTATISPGNAVESLPPDYHLSVGDLCFYCLGQIINRHFDPISCLMSTRDGFVGPSATPGLASEAQREWGRPTRQHLFQSLCIDAVHPDRAWRDFDAIRRLKADFPKQVAGVALRRLHAPIADHFDYSIPGENDRLIYPRTLTSEQFSGLLEALSDVPSHQIDETAFRDLEAIHSLHSPSSSDDVRALAIISRIGYLGRRKYLALCISHCRSRIGHSQWDRRYKAALKQLEHGAPSRSSSFPFSSWARAAGFTSQCLDVAMLGQHTPGGIGSGTRQSQVADIYGAAFPLWHYELVPVLFARAETPLGPRRDRINRRASLK